MQNDTCSGLKPPEEGKGDNVCVYQNNFFRVQPAGLRASLV